MIILGIDPGTVRIGYGLIEKIGRNKIAFVEAGLLTIGAASHRSTVEVGDHLEKIIKKFKPSLVVIEKLYFSKNRKTALRVAENRGVLAFVAERNRLPVKELAPSEVKALITGYGQADKKSVAKMVKIILKKPELSVVDDATDALALALAGSQKNLEV